MNALVVLRAGSDLRPEECIEGAYACITVFKVSRIVQLVVSLSKTATGKIPWRELQE